MLKNVINHRLVRQILRFCVVGGLAFIVDFGLLVFLTEIAGWNYLWSATCSFIVSCVFNYFLSVYWVFDRSIKQQGWKRLVQMALFIGLASCGLAINNLIMWFTVEIIGESYILGKLVATFIVMIFNYITRKIMLERTPKIRAEVISGNTDTISGRTESIPSKTQFTTTEALSNKTKVPSNYDRS